MKTAQLLTAALLLIAAAGVETVIAADPASASTHSAGAQAASAGAWAKLSLDRRVALAPLILAWPSLDDGQRQKWLEVADRLPRMSLEDQARLRERMAEWTAMTPAERGRARLRFQETRQLSQAERQQQWAAYQALPAAERREWADRNSARVAGRLPSAEVARPGAAASSSKRNLVLPAPANEPAQTVAPTVVRASAGASTKLVTKASTPPPHHQPGLPKVAATPDFVNKTTLLPVRGPQGAAVKGGDGKVVAAAGAAAAALAASASSVPPSEVVPAASAAATVPEPTVPAASASAR